MGAAIAPQVITAVSTGTVGLAGIAASFWTVRQNNKHARQTRLEIEAREDRLRNYEALRAATGRFFGQLWTCMAAAQHVYDLKEEGAPEDELDDANRVLRGSRPTLQIAIGELNILLSTGHRTELMAVTEALGTFMGHPCDDHGDAVDERVRTFFGSCQKLLQIV